MPSREKAHQHMMQLHTRSAEEPIQEVHLLQALFGSGRAQLL
ncbi:MAG TPA: hypothetical protein VH593_34120 [Ktedonobacteraceae bacterium]